jgi:response regulator RpfG family c-di-GMP phosphodiesterase
MRKATVLVVDDEPNILRSLVRLLRRDGYNILTAGSGAEGLELLAQHDVEVIISDQRMPGMTGTEFLSRVKELYPDTVRIVLSGYTDLESITDAINHGAIYKFLTKPWDDELLRDNVRQAIEQHELRAENRRLTEELSEANKALSLQLAEQDRELITHQRILELSREVLEHLPVGVLGVDDDGVIAVVNTMAHTLLGSGDSELFGGDVESVLPQQLAEVCKLAAVGAHNQPHYMELETDGRMVKVYCSSLSGREDSRGKVVVLLPDDEEGAGSR